VASRKSKLHVTKTLEPDQPGAVRLTQKYGDALLCVRYRQDALGLVRYTTVELIVDEAQISANLKRLVGVKVGYLDEELRARVRSAGARWDPASKLWRMPLSVACALGVTERVVECGPKVRLDLPTS
jgi:hypothetical protein